VAVLIHRIGQGADADDVIVDLHRPGDGPYGALADCQPAPLE